MRLVMISLALMLLASEALADGASVNATAFPLPNSNQLFPNRNNRLSLKCFNSLANGAATITYASGFAVILAPGGSLWETVRPPQGILRATGTAGNVLQCEDYYQ